MALFRPFMGNRTSLDAVEKHAGYVYLCVDDGSFHLDYADSEGKLHRKQINANEANKLVGYDISTSLSSTDEQIPTSKAVLTALAGKANDSHSHDDKYYTEAEIDSKISTLNTAIAGKSDSGHNHDDKYYTETEINTKLATKSDTDHTHSNYVPTTRTVNGKALSANVTLAASDVGALSADTKIPSALSDLTADSTHRTVTDTEKATWNAKSNFSGNYNDLTNKPTIPSIAGLATTAYVDEVANGKVDKVSGKGLSTNDYTTTEKNKLAGIDAGAQVNQNAFSNVVVGSTTIAADAVTDSLTIAAGTGISVSGDATNDKVTITNSGVRTIATGSANGTISVNTNGTAADVAVKGLGSAAYTASTAYDAAGTAQTKADAALASAKTYADGIKNALLNGAGAAYDTLKELGDLIDDNVDAIEALETVAAGKADKVHTHAISDITNLQSTLDGKAASSHGTHVTYSTTAPVMDGTAAAGSADTVARSDHKHPTDTSRAAKTDLDTHTGNTTVHITATERTNWGTAYTHSQATHAPTNAEKNQNAFSNIAVSGQTTVAADTATDTVTFAGSNVTITTDATNDKVTFAVADGSTSAKGVVQLTNSTSSTSTTTAATPSSVKSAYDLANTTKTNLETEVNRAKAAEAQIVADSTWTKIYDSGSITSKVNAFSGIDMAGYKKIKVAIKCANTNDSAGSSAADIAFVEYLGDSGETITYSFFGLFGNLISKGTTITAAMAEFTVVDGFIICDNALRSTSASNMFAAGEGQGAWNMTSVGGGLLTCYGAVSEMRVSSAYSSETHYFGAGSRVIVWGCKA